MAERNSESDGRPAGAAEGDAVEGNAGDGNAGNGGATLPATYAVGKGKPPVGSRFVKGRSGNPAGRPRVRGGSGMAGDRLLGSDQPTRMMILEEAYRTITVQDGETEIEIPANRAVFRALMERALRGSRIAQRRWMEMVEDAELQQKADQQVLYSVLELPKRKRLFEPGTSRHALVLKWSDEIVADPNLRRTVIRRMEEE